MRPTPDRRPAVKPLRSIAQAADLLRISRAVSVSPDGSRVAIIRDDNNAWIIGLTNGVPDFNSRLLLTNAPNTTLGRDIAFDAAGNLYTVSSGQGLLRVFSPGGISTAITDSDGTFGVIKPDQTVVVSATDDFATESGDTGAFTLTRAGNTARALTVPMPVMTTRRVISSPAPARCSRWPRRPS